jgi:hypothetical protein
MSSATIAGTVADLRPAERREHERFKAHVPLEFSQEGGVVNRAETADLSLGGCYVEMMFTLEVGTRLQITMWVNGEKLRCQGVVVTRHVQFGNGIQFHDMKLYDRSRLRLYLESLQAEDVPRIC